MKKEKNESSNQNRKNVENNKPGYGDKKLEGPDRPST